MEPAFSRRRFSPGLTRAASDGQRGKVGPDFRVVFARFATSFTFPSGLDRPWFSI